MEYLGTVIGGVIVAVIVIAILVRLLAWLYLKSTGDVALVRTGFGGAKVIRSGGALVIPVIHQTTPVNMNTQRLEVRRADAAALQTRDNMRVNVQAAFYLHVMPERDAILRAAETLGAKTMNPEALGKLVEGKFVDALRAAAAETEMRVLHEQRGDYVKRVAERVRGDLKANGLALESVSLTELDQAGKEFFNPSNAFDAEGLTRLSREIEERRRIRNEIERDTELAIQRKALDVETKQLEIVKSQLEIEREAEFARLQQKQDVAFRRAQQTAEIAREEAARSQTARDAQIEAERLVEAAEITARHEVDSQRVETERALAQARIKAEQTIKEQELRRAEALDLVGVARSVVVQSAEHERDIQLARKSKERAAAVAESEAGHLAVRESVEKADIALKRAVEAARLDAELAVTKKRIETERDIKQSETAKSLAIEEAAVERAKQIELAEHERAIVVANKAVERYAALIATDKKRAESVACEQEVATAREATIADGRRKIADLEADRAAIVAAGEATAEKARLEATERKYSVEAAGKRALAEADNRMSRDQVDLRVKLAMLEHLPDIIRESAKPIQAIDKIQIVQVEGLNGGSGNGGGAPSDNFAEQMVSSALRYRAQAPVVDAVLGELGMSGASLAGLVQALPHRTAPVDAARAAADGNRAGPEAKS